MPSHLQLQQQLSNKSSLEVLDLWAKQGLDKESLCDFARTLQSFTTVNNSIRSNLQVINSVN